MIEAGAICEENILNCGGYLDIKLSLIDNSPRNLLRQIFCLSYKLKYNSQSLCVGCNKC